MQSPIAFGASKQIDIASAVDVPGWAAVGWVPAGPVGQTATPSAPVYSFFKNRASAPHTFVLLVDVPVQAENAWVRTQPFYYDAVAAVANPVAAQFLLKNSRFIPWPATNQVPAAAVYQMPWIHGAGPENQVLVVGLPLMSKPGIDQVGHTLARLVSSGPIALLIVSDLSSAVGSGNDRRPVDAQVLDHVTVLQTEALRSLGQKIYDQQPEHLSYFSSPHAVWCGCVAAGYAGANAIAYGGYSRRWDASRAEDVEDSPMKDSAVGGMKESGGGDLDRYKARMVQVGQIGAVFYDRRRTRAGQLVENPAHDAASDKQTVLTEREQAYLLKVARNAAEAAAVSAGYRLPEPESVILRQRRAAFLILSVENKPVRMVGSFSLQSPLYDQVIRLAKSAVISSGIGAEPLRHAKIDLVFPSQPDSIGDWRKVDPATQGVMVEYGGQRGVAFGFELENQPAIAADESVKRLWELACQRASISPNAVWRGAAFLSVFSITRLQEPSVR